MMAYANKNIWNIMLTSNNNYIRSKTLARLIIEYFTRKIDDIFHGKRRVKECMDW